MYVAGDSSATFGSPVNSYGGGLDAFVAKLAAGGVTYQTSAETSAAATTSITLTNFNPGSGANRVLVVALSFDGVPTGVTVTYGGTPLTLVPNTSGVVGGWHRIRTVVVSHKPVEHGGEYCRILDGIR